MSEREENIIRAYVENGEKLEGFAVVKHRFQNKEFNSALLDDQVELLALFKLILETEQ